MKNIRNALKLFWKASMNPLTIGFGIFMAAGMTLAFITDPAAPGEKDYLSMIDAVGIGHIGAVFIIMIGGMKTSQNKFYASASCAKDIYTTAPVLIALIAALIYDVLIASAAAMNLGRTAFSDVVLFNSVSGGLMIICCAAIGKKGLSHMVIVPYVGIVAPSFILKHFHGLDNGLALQPAAAVVIALVIYTVCAASAWLISYRWWKNGNRIGTPVKSFDVPEEEMP